MLYSVLDSNGRLDCALQTMVLAREKIVDPNFRSIEEYLGTSTQDCYKVLADEGRGAWHPKNDALPWIKFCLTAHYRQAETLVRHFKEMARLRETLESRAATLSTIK